MIGLGGGYKRGVKSRRRKREDKRKNSTLHQGTKSKGRPRIRLYYHLDKKSRTR